MSQMTHNVLYVSQVSPLTNVRLGKRSLESSELVQISGIFCLKPNVIW